MEEPPGIPRFPLKLTVVFIQLGVYCVVKFAVGLSFTLIVCIFSLEHKLLEIHQAQNNPSLCNKDETG